MARGAKFSATASAHSSRGAGPARPPSGSLRLKRDVALPDVQLVVHRRALEPVRVVGSERVHAEEVGSAPRLDPQHRGALLDEVAGRDRPGRARAELEDAHPGPGAPPGVARPGRGPARRCASRAAPRRRRRSGRDAPGRRRATCVAGVADLHERREERPDVADRRRRSRGRASCSLARISGGEFAGASIRLVSHGDLVELPHGAAGEVLGDRRLDGAQHRVVGGVGRPRRPVLGSRGRRRRRRTRRRGG